MQADAAELRVLGCLIEKQRTTPDAYPLSLNALRIACNQSTNRDPVVEYDDATIRQALERLNHKGWLRLASGPGSRAAKFRHLFDEAMHVSDEEISILAVLMLRGPQTPGELKQRTHRLHPFADLAALEASLQGLIERELVERLPRQPGQKEQRYRHLLEEEAIPRAAPVVEEREPEREPEPDRLDALERELRELRDEVAALRSELDSGRGGPLE
ncbi:MAG: YceH family protein [Gaiellaceae bacterium]